LSRQWQNFGGEFTMQELQKLYETILDKPLRRDNFQWKMLDMNILERLEKNILELIPPLFI
jgi:hypothetical protein